MVAIRQNPLNLFYCLYWLLKSRIHFENKIYQFLPPKLNLLPLNQEFYEFLRVQKTNQQQIVLIADCPPELLQKICKSFEIFDLNINYSSHEPNFANELLQKMKSSSDKFSIASDCCKELEFCQGSNKRYLVNPSKQELNIAKNLKIDRVFDLQPNFIKLWLKQIRIHQWLKNMLVFVPLLVSGSFLNFDLISKSLLAFFGFSLLASATYIINDLMDLDSDRAHLRKNVRPIAAGRINVVSALVAVLALLLVTYLLLYSAPIKFNLILLFYLVLTLSYSVKIKQLFIADVFVLSILYTLRIIAGAAVINVELSLWLLSFSMFIFLSLALIKRCAELKSLIPEHNKTIVGRGYSSEDYPILMNVGIGASVISMGLFCLYIKNNMDNAQYQSPYILWFTVPALGYWLCRMWVKTDQGKMHDDPIVFSLKDAISLSTIFILVIIVMAAQLL